MPSPLLVPSRARGGFSRVAPYFFMITSLLLPSAPHAADAADAADVAEAPPDEIEEITVQASGLGRTADELVQPVEVLSGEALDKKRSNTIGGTLENEPGVATTDFGPGAGRPVIRGQAGPRVEVLENGIGSLDASDVSTDHAVTIDPSHATQVEVIKGPATLLYGNGASAGVVNVVDGRLPSEVTDGLHGSGEGTFGSNGDERYGTAELGYGSGNHQLHADYARRDSDNYDIPGNALVDGGGSQGFLSNSAAESRSGSLSYGYVDGGNSFAVSASRFKTQYGLPVEETAFIDLSQKRYDVQGILAQPLPFLESVKLRAGYNDYGHTEFEAPGEPGTVFMNKQSQSRIEAVHVPLAGWRGVFGVQYGDRDFAAIGEEAFVPRTTTRQLGLFVVEERPWSLGKLELGARIERDSNNPEENPSRDFTPLSLSAGSVFNLGAEYHLKAYATRAERSPVTEELYAFGPHGATSTFERGQVDLDKEVTNNFEIGLDHHGARLAWQANVYYQQFKNYIYQQELDAGLNADGSGVAAVDGQADRVDEEGAFEPDGDLLLVDYRQADATFYGAEFQTTYALLNSGPFKLDLRGFADTVRGEIDDGGNLPRITPSRIGFGFDAEQGPFAGSVSYTRVDEQRHRAVLETPTEGYNLLSADLSYSFKLTADAIDKSEIYLRGRNLLDEEIRRATSFLKDVSPAPGISAQIGVRLVF